MALPVESEKELSIGGFQGIKKIRGLLVGIDVVDPPSMWENQEKQVVKVDMEETTVLEMFGDEDSFELKDGKFSFYIPYVEAGKNPHKNSIYNRCWLESAKEQGKKPSELIGSIVTLEKQPRLLFQKYIIDPDTKKAKLDDDGEKVKEDILAVNEAGLPNHFCFAADETADSTSLQGYVREKIVGLNRKAALRKILIDPKKAQLGEFKDMLNNGTLADYLDLVLVGDGDNAKFQEPEM